MLDTFGLIVWSKQPPCAWTVADLQFTRTTRSRYEAAMQLLAELDESDPQIEYRVAYWDDAADRMALLYNRGPRREPNLDDYVAEFIDDQRAYGSEEMRSFARAA